MKNKLAFKIGIFVLLIVSTWVLYVQFIYPEYNAWKIEQNTKKEIKNQGYEVIGGADSNTGIHTEN